MISSKKPSSVFEPTKVSHRDEKREAEVHIMQIDPVTSSDKNSKHHVPSASVASVVDEMPEDDLDYGGLTTNEKPKDYTDSTNFFSAQKIQKQPPAAITSHSAMNNNDLMKPSNLVKGDPPKGIGVKSQLTSHDSVSSGAIVQSQGLLHKPIENNPVKEKKFSLVPFAKAKSSSVYSSASEVTSLTQVPVIKNPQRRMELIHETPDEAKDATLASPPSNTKKSLVKEAEDEDQDDNDDDDDDDDYEDDNDFEPFETSKKDFYQAES